jgi:hypothetical protein
MRATRRIMAAKALAKYRPEELKPGSAVQSQEALEKAAGELGTTIFHPARHQAEGPRLDRAREPNLAPDRPLAGLHEHHGGRGQVVLGQGRQGHRRGEDAEQDARLVHRANPQDSRRRRPTPAVFCQGT